jgi:DNA-binding CsgD family transcriptional regulator
VSTKVSEVVRKGEAPGKSKCYKENILIMIINLGIIESPLRPLPRETPLTRGLAPREREVLHLLSTGRPYKQIADELKLSMGTIRTYIRRLYSKMEVNCRTEAVVKYLTAWAWTGTFATPLAVWVSEWIARLIACVVLRCQGDDFANTQLSFLRRAWLEPCVSPVRICLEDDTVWTLSDMKAGDNHDRAFTLLTTAPGAGGSQGEGQIYHLERFDWPEHRHLLVLKPHWLWFRADCVVAIAQIIRSQSNADKSLLAMGSIIRSGGMAAFFSILDAFFVICLYDCIAFPAHLMLWTDMNSVVKEW